MLGLACTIIVLVWAFYGLHAIGLLQSALVDISQPIAKWLDEPGNLVRAVVWIVASLLVVIAWTAEANTIIAKLQGEITGIAVTVIIIDELVGYRNKLQRKQEIFEEIESPVRDVAVEAVRLARKYGWLNEALRKADLNKAQLAGADLEDANLQGMSLISADLQGARLARANLQGAHLGSTKMQGAVLQDTNLQGAHFEHAKLQGAILIRTKLEGAKMINVDLQDAFIFDVNLQGVFLHEIDLHNSFIDFNTTWPEGFELESAGGFRREK
jgi:hypothetical protein